MKLKRAISHAMLETAWCPEYVLAKEIIGMDMTAIGCSVIWTKVYVNEMNKWTIIERKYAC